ncbi:MAG: autotransporter-associated beta strand repeat-containing protein [Planctomycetaceae bacterium]|nr:autotransporter-associated beta strand repeat-containing protein [Planctomycetaceae bacterium]
MVRSWLSGLRQKTNLWISSGLRRRKRRANAVGSLENLEQRQLLTARVWDGGGGVANNTWSNPLNWSGDVAPVAGDDLVFPGSASVHVTVNDTNTLFKSISLESSSAGAGYQVSGTPIRLIGGVSATTTTSTFHEIKNAISLEGAAAHSILAGPGVTLQLDSTVSGATAISKSGTGRMILAGANTFTGAFQALAGVTQLAHSNALGTTAGATSVSPGAAIERVEFVGIGEEFPRLLNVAENVSLSGHGIGGTGALRNVSGNNKWTGTVTLGGGLENSIGVDAPNAEFQTDQLLISGVVKDGSVAGFHKVGGGRLFLSGTNTYRSSTLIDQGVIQIQNSSALGSAVGITRVQVGAALELDDVNLGGGETLSLTVAEPLQLLGTGTDAAGALRNIEGNNIWSGAVTLLSPTSVGVDRTDDVLTVTSVISGAAASSLTKVGTGKLRTTGVNTFSGPTTIQTGTLEVNGNSVSSAITVVNGTLAGTGTTGPVAVQKNGTISPGGNAVGTLNVKGLSSLGTIVVTAGTSIHDVINVTGRVDIGNSAIVVNGSTGLNKLNVIANDSTDVIVGTTNATKVTSSAGQVFGVSYTGGTGNDLTLVRQNVAPMLTNRAISSILTEGDQALLTATIVDPDILDKFFMSVDWGDGSLTRHTFNPGTPRDIALSHRYQDDGVYTVRMVWTDNSGTGNSGTMTTTVQNAAPVFEAGSNASARVNSIFERRIQFVDAPKDIAFVSIDFGDGSLPQLLAPGTARSFRLSHRFGVKGTFKVTVTITDNGGAATSDAFFVTVS